MALLQNGFRQISVGRLFGSSVIDGSNADCLSNMWTQSGRMDNSAIGEGYESSGQVLSYPDDMNVPYAYHPAQIAGRMASYSTIIGEGNASPDLRLTMQALADLIGSGDAEAIGGLIVQLFANVAGNGSITDADIKAFLLMAANITGSGSAAANIFALAQLVSFINGSGSTSSTLTGTGAMSADILAYGELTPEGIRDSIWNALATQYNRTGTMGEKVNDAGSASNPWTEIIETGLSAGEILKLLLSVAAGDATGLDESAVFKSVDGTKNRITATISGENRTITSRDPS